MNTFDNIEDAELVNAARDGEYRAFDELVTRYRGKIYAMLYNLVRNDSDAWDLAQDAFLKAWKGLGKFEGKSSFTTWMYRIAHNVAYDFLRKKRVRAGDEFIDPTGRADVISEAPTVPQGEVRPDIAMENSELGLRIEDAMAKLSDDHREVIVLKDIQGLKYEEIAEVLDVKLGTVMSRIFHARKKLQITLADLRS